MDPGDTTIAREVFKRRAGDVAGQFIVEHLWKILVGVVGFFSGGAVTYVAIWTQISDARHAAYDAKETAQRVEASVAQLVTQRELQDWKERVVTLEDRLDYAKKEAGGPPNTHRKRPQ